MRRAHGAMQAETRSIGQLVEAVKRLQVAVASDDAGGIDDALFRYRRISFTLREARTLRRSLIACLSDEGDRGLDAVCESPYADEEFRRTREQLRASSRELATQLGSCRHMLRDAFDESSRDIPPDLTADADDAGPEWTPR